MKSLAALALLVVAVLSQVGQAAQSQLQEMVATVRNREGALVNGLRPEDFILEVDGRPQTIVSLTVNPKNPAGIGLVIDRGPLGLTGIGGAITERDAGIAAARIFIRAATKSGDELMLIALAGQAGYKVIEPLTQDPARIDSGLRSLYTWDINSSYREVLGDYQGLFEIARALGELKNARSRSRALVMTTTGCCWRRDPQFVAQIAQIRAAEIPVYVIGFPGLLPSSSLLVQDAGAWERGIPEGRAAVEKSREELTTETGGRAITILPNMDENVVERLMAFAAEVSVDLRGQYSLKFNAPPGESLGQVIRLRTNVPEHQVRSRRLPAN